MGLPRRQRRQLRRINAEISRSDPHLAGMLAVFARLAEDEPLPRWEEMRTQWRWAVAVRRRKASAAGRNTTAGRHLAG
jgi:hypothetical protein